MKFVLLLSSLVAVEAQWWQRPQGHNHDGNAGHLLHAPPSKVVQLAAVGADCNEDNCLRAMIREGGVGATPFCHQFTSAVVTDTAALPTYASMCTPDAVSGVSSACSCLVSGLATTTPTSQSTITGALLASSASSTSSPFQLVSAISRANLSVAAAAPTYEPRPGCNEDNCLRAMIREGNIDATPFCQTFTTAVITDTSALPTYASMCTPDPISGISSACSCYASAPQRLAQSTTTATVTLATTTIEITVTMDGPGNIGLNTSVSFGSSIAPTGNPSSEVAQRSSTDIRTLSTLPPVASQTISRNSSTTGRNASALAIPTSGPVSPIIATCPNPVTCQASAACSPDSLCLCQPSVDGIGYCLADTPCSNLRNCTTNADCGTGSACMITCCSTHKCLDVPFLCPNPGTPMRLFAKRDFFDWDLATTNGHAWGHTGKKATTDRTTQTGPQGALDCQQDNCLRELEDYRFIASAYTFCQTYTTTVNPEPTAIPTYLENCGSNPSAVSSACSCLVESVTQGAPKSTPTTASISAPTPTPLDCQADNCLRELEDRRFNAMAVKFCASYTTALITEPSAIPAYLENCEGSPGAVSSACSCIMATATGL
jgi:hypothetical protein